MGRTSSRSRPTSARPSARAPATPCSCAWTNGSASPASAAVRRPAAVAWSQLDLALLRQRQYVEGTRLLVDNSNGADAQFASDLRVALTAAGFEVELREPSPLALYDTSVHFVVEGVAIRLQDDPRQFDLAAIAKTVRETEARRPSEHRRFRDVPIYAGESSRVLTWVDVFD